MSAESMSAAGSRAWHEFALWCVALLLILPAVAPYAMQYLTARGAVPTGFIQGDQPNYMAAAREYFDDGGVKLLYGNPLDGNYDTPRIYFQPQTFLLGLVERVTGGDPGIVFELFGLIAALCLVRVLIGLFARLVGIADKSQRIVFLLFVWGGGALVLCGLAVTSYYWLFGGSFSYRAVFQFDPFGGWWMLNLGRNLVQPLESYYHVLFFGCVLLLIRERYVLALACAVALSASHPYTGTELLAVLFPWSFIETVVVKRRHVPAYFFVGVSVLLIAHVAYYLIYLPSHAEHRELMAEWDQPWFLSGATMAAAYLPVGLAALWQLRNRLRLTAFLSESRGRLLAVWFVAAFLLANHQWFMHPVEPLHFTRGYIWSSLFLIGAPSMVRLVDRLRSRGTPLAGAGLAAMVLFFLLDNAVWVSSVASPGYPGFIRLTQSQRHVLDWINAQTPQGALLVSEDPLVSRMSAVYTPVRPWAAVRGITRQGADRDREVQLFFSMGRTLPEWGSRPLFVLVENRRHTPAEVRALTERSGAGRGVAAEFSDETYTGLLFR